MTNLGHEYLAFVISFVVIAAFWFSHHRFFRNVATLNHLLIRLNLMSLFAIVLVPFATRILAVHRNIWFGPVFYALVMVLFGVSYVLMARVADLHKLWREGTPPTVAAEMVVGISSALAIFALSIPLAFISPTLALCSWLLMPVAASGLPRLHSRFQARTRQRQD